MKKTILIILLLIFANTLFSQTINEVLSDRYFKAGLTRFYSRQYDAAIQLFNQSLSVLPMNFKARYFLGHAFLNAGYSKNALEEWENLIRLGGANYQVKQKLNDLYFQLAMDKSYDYSSPYILSRIYDGIENGMHKIIRPSFIEYDPRSDSILVSSAQTKFVVEVDGNGSVLHQFGRTFSDQSELKMPMGICLFRDKVYIADYEQDLIYIYQRDGRFVTKFGVKGFQSSNIAGPMGLYVSPDEYLFVADNGNDRIQKFDMQGNWIQSIGEGSLKMPTDIAGSGNVIYVSDTRNARVVVYDTFGNFIENIGEKVLRQPRGLTYKDGKLFIMDEKQGLFVYTVQTRAMEKFVVDEGKLKLPFDVCLDGKGLIYQTDFNTQNIAIFIPLELQYVNLGVQASQIWLSAYPRNFIHVRVWDKKGQPVYNLKEENFILYEDGLEIPLIRLGATTAYRKNMFVPIIIDKSLPMKEYEPELTESLRAFLNNMSGEDWLDTVIVRDTIESSGKRNASVLWTMDYIQKHEYIGNAPAELDKALYNNITGLLNINRNKAIILFTTGFIAENTFKDYDAEVITTYAKQNAIPIYVISLGNRNESIFRRIAEGTFGKYYTVSDTKEILALYDEIKNSLPLEYIIGYDGMDLKGLKNFWVNVHLKVKYKGMFGVDDVGYYVPELKTPSLFESANTIDLQSLTN